MVGAVPYDIQTVAAGLRRRRQQVAGEVTTRKRMMNRTTMEPEEREELAQLIAGGADREATRQWGKERGLNGNTVRSAHIAIAKEQGLWPPESLADRWDGDHVYDRHGEGKPPAEEPLLPARQTVVERAARDDPNLLAWLNATNPVVTWIDRIHALRDELRELGVTVEGTLSITIDL